MAGLANIVRGDTYTLALDLSAYGVSIEGHSFALTLKDDLADADAEAKLVHLETVAAGSEADAGFHAFEVSATETAALAPGEYHYDLQWTQPGSPDRVTTLVRSGEQVDGSDIDKIRVLADVRRAVP